MNEKMPHYFYLFEIQFAIVRECLNTHKNPLTMNENCSN